VPNPYVLALCSHKGGTGRSTAAAALAWCFGRAGLDVVLVDADEVRAVSLIARDIDGDCHWPHVRLCRSPEEASELPAAHLWLIDCPSLMEPAAVPVLERANGVILTCLADPLSLRTLPAAATSLDAARVANPKLELLGMLVGIYEEGDALQSAMLAQVRERHGELLLEPPIPLQPEVRDWPLALGGLPSGPASEAFFAVARSLDAWIRAGPRG